MTKKAISKSKKISSSRKRFDLSSGRIRFLITILIIGIVGGGVLVYRSYALTETASAFAAALPTANRSGARVGTETKESTKKKDTQIVRLAPGATLDWYTSLTPFSSRPDIACATVRYENPSPSSRPAKLTLSLTPLVHDSSTKSIVTRYASSHSTYQRVCTGPVTKLLGLRVKFAVTNHGPSTARVGKVTIEQ